MVSDSLLNLKYETFKDHSEFLKIFNGGYFVEWDCGADLSRTMEPGILSLFFIWKNRAHIV